MKITRIAQQVKLPGRYSVYVDGEYSFSLSETALLESGLASGRELTDGELQQFQRLSEEDKMYAQALRYVAARMHSSWEMQTYLERKGGSPALTEIILNKLTELGLIDDFKYARMFVGERRRLRYSSRRKIMYELQKKHISDSAITAALSEEPEGEQTALQTLIANKRRQTKYQDNEKLLQYLARQGYNYGDIKQAISASTED